MDTRRKGPMVKSRHGRFQVSVWRTNRLQPARSGRGPKKPTLTTRISVQHSTWDRFSRVWHNQTIWFGSDELTDLEAAMKGLDRCYVPDEAVVDLTAPGTIPR